MSRNYDNWERLVAAVIKREQLWQLFHAPSRTPSLLSDSSSDFNPSSNLTSARFSSFRDSVGIAVASSSSIWQQREAEAALIGKFQKSLLNLAMISDFVPDLDVKGVSLASVEFLGIGNSGKVYAVATKNGSKFVVRSLNSVAVSETVFRRQMEIAGNVVHRNVAALRAYCYSEDQQLMLYDYHSDGSVLTLLHGNADECLDWDTRLRVAIGAARGIAAIHTHQGGKLVHGNIKSSNIFLNPEKNGCVSDLGMTYLTTTTFTSSARCYAPEVQNTLNVSQASDVYSFGILLLELVTGKCPVDLPDGREAVDLVTFVITMNNKERNDDVFDADLLIRHPTVKEHMAKLLQIGLKCAAKAVRDRPTMPEVVKMLEDVIPINMGGSLSSQGKLIFLDGNLIFDLKYMLGSSAEHLGRGMYGSSYKVSLDNYGEAVLVKRSKYVNVTFDEFQKLVAVIGGMKHENVATLKAFYFSADNVFFVYDYYSRGSLSDLLHGKNGGNKMPFHWERRKKIALDAAKGIAHIHQQDDGKLVHGNIKSSNVLLNPQHHGIVSEAGLAKMMKPIRRSDTRAQGYFAPEIESSLDASQASDVYSFGVVLLELITGRPSSLYVVDSKVVSLVDWIQLVDWILYVNRDEWNAKVMDLEVLRNEEEMEEALVLLEIAQECVKVAPESRATMVDVVNKLEKLNDRKEHVRILNESNLL